MNKDINIIFVDIDWTILDHKSHNFDIESLNGLKEAQKNGVLVYICTARPYESIIQIKLLDIFMPDGIICTNGGLVFYHDEVILANVFPVEIVRNVIATAKKYKLPVEYGTIRERYFAIAPNKYVNKYFNTFCENLCPVREYQDDQITSLLLMCPKRFDKRVLRRISKELDYFRFDDFGVDIRYVKNDKGKAIEHVLNYHKLNYDNAMSIGDDLQDIFMFEKTRYSVAMGNAKKEVIDASNYVTENIENHGVLAAIKHFDII